jgi:hypothetical protein
MKHFIAYSDPEGLLCYILEKVLFTEKPALF